MSQLIRYPPPEREDSEITRQTLGDEARKLANVPRIPTPSRLQAQLRRAKTLATVSGTGKNYVGHWIHHRRCRVWNLRLSLNNCFITGAPFRLIVEEPPLWPNFREYPTFCRRTKARTLMTGLAGKPPRKRANKQNGKGKEKNGSAVSYSSKSLLYSFLIFTFPDRK